MNASISLAPFGLEAVRAWALRHALTVADAAVPWAVAYSGGADSTALLLAAQALWPGRVQAFHVHHGLQAAADGFEAHARVCCARWGIPLQVAHVQARHQPGDSPEDAARRARYRALAELARAHGAAGVLLGQHAQDQLETLLLALSRGAGLPGLAGMPEAMQRHGVAFGRPFLTLNGEALRAHLHQQHIPYITDPTNADPRYTRNRIRAQVLPALQAAFPACLDTFARSARHAAQAQTLLHEVAEQDLATIGNPPAVRALQGLTHERQANVLRHWLRQGWNASPSEAQLRECLRQIAACTTRGHRLRLKLANGYLERDGHLLCYTPTPV